MPEPVLGPSFLRRPRDPDHKGLAAGRSGRASGVQASDQHKCTSKRFHDGLVQTVEASGVKTDIVCAGQRLAEEGRVPLYASSDSE